MQHFFQNLQGKIWIYLVNGFEKLIQLSHEYWIFLKPYFENSLNWIKKTFQYLSSSLSYFFSLLQKILNLALNEFNQAILVFEKIYNQNKYEGFGIIFITSLVIIFWLWMVVHVRRNEIFHKKLWLAITILFGPIGAIAYYILRKRKLEKEQAKHDKVMMGFFSPMHNANGKENK